MVIVGLFLHDANVECGFDNPCQNQKKLQKNESEDYFYHFIKKEILNSIKVKIQTSLHIPFK